MKIQAKTLKTGLRGLLLGATVVGVMPMAVGCLDRPVAPASPRTSNTVTQKVSFAAVNKIDLVFMIDNSSSMADKQKVLSRAVPDLVKRLVNPDCVKFDENNQVDEDTRKSVDADQACETGAQREFAAIKDIHIAVLTSSLGGHGSDYCDDANDVANPDDHGRPINRKLGGGTVPTYQDAGFLAWDPDKTSPANNPPGEPDLDTLNLNFTSLVEGADQKGCGFESSLEAWYRFLIDPNPPASVTVNPKAEAEGRLDAAIVTGTDDLLLQQRTQFLRPDSLVAVVSLSDENDCSIIDGVMPPDVCETPTLDESGKVTGCSGARQPWPANYGRGNFQGFTVTDGRVSGTPFPVNQVAAQNNVPAAATSSNCAERKDGKALNKEFCTRSGTSACETDPDSAACKSCLLIDPNSPDYAAQGCRSLTNDDPKGDPINLRCWNQKQRFGVDMLYPLQRYIDGLQNPTVYDRDGNKVPNPLFEDLPYKKSVADKQPLARGKADARNQQLVFFATINGVPWQDIARDSTDLTKGYKPVVASETDPAQIDFDLILGNPFGYDGQPRKDPTDPLMIESNVSDDPAHLREGKPHPITGETVSATGWNSINGREWVSAPSDLQFACIFDLAGEVAADFPDCSPSDSQSSNPEKKNPLCEDRISATDTKGAGTYADKKQYRAKAYPGTRFLQVAKSFGANAVVASICAPNLKNEDARDFGYRPAVSAIIDRLKSQLATQCLPRQLDVSRKNADGTGTEGVAPCLIIDASNPTPDKLNECLKCDSEKKDREPVDPAIDALLTGEVKDKYSCRCAIKQFAGNDLQKCRTDAAMVSGDSGGGWCYVDPASATSDADKAAAENIVKSCPATQRRNIRFINTETSNSTLFITCLGAASGNNDLDPSTGAAGSGTAGAAGQSGAAGAGN